jgi:hypothetical protein
MAFLNISVETANKFYAWGWRASILGAVITAIAVIFLMWGTRVRDRASEGALAGLNSSAARAHERAAALEKEAADANLRTAEIMKATAWRQLLPEQQQKILEVLSKKPGKVVLAWIANDPESLGLAVQLSDLLAKAHWEVAGSARTYPSVLLWDIHIPATRGAEGATQSLRDAFTNANIHIVTDPLPQHAMEIGSGGAPGSATILVGCRVGM